LRKSYSILQIVLAIARVTIYKLIATNKLNFTLKEFIKKQATLATLNLTLLRLVILEAQLAIHFLTN
jgi:hypothetical protein